MRTGSIVCFVMAVLFTMVGINNLFNSPNKPDANADMVGYAVGSFLPGVVLLILGIWLATRQKK